MTDSLDPRAWYFDVRFRAESPITHWPTEFIIVTGYATTGEVWPEEQNLEADLRLRRELQEMGRWHVRLTGYSPETGHAEPGWAVLLTAAEGGSTRPSLCAGCHLRGAARCISGALLRRWARGEGRVVAGAHRGVRSAHADGRARRDGMIASHPEASYVGARPDGMIASHPEASHVGARPAAPGPTPLKCRSMRGGAPHASRRSAHSP
ncbi:MAG: hypothetical protein IPJ11_07375 [Gemmatimonadetes bacterium]|nr:hypothetical protein [Gemmatimonadota bacterium]